jgi:hypothetical protein
LNVIISAGAMIYMTKHGASTVLANQGRDCSVQVPGNALSRGMHVVSLLQILV